MNQRHLTRRQAVPAKSFTWARIPMGDTHLCYRLLRRDKGQVQHMETMDFGHSQVRSRIAQDLRRMRKRLSLTISKLEKLMNDPLQRAPRRMLQPTKDQIREKLAHVEEENKRLRAVLDLPWWKRLLGRRP